MTNQRLIQHGGALPQTVPLPPSLWSAIAGRAGLPWPLRTDAEIDAFVQAVEALRMLALAEEDAALPARIRERAAQRDRVIAPAQTAYARQQQELFAWVTRHLPCDWLSVKGADYVGRFYPSLRHRPMKDVDILVRPHDVPRVAAALIGSGFSGPPAPQPLDKQEHAYTVPGGSTLWLDVYDRFTDARRADVDYAEIWAGRVHGADGLPRMSAPHALTMHVLVLANMQFVIPVRKFLDVWLFARDPEVVAGAFDCARRWNLRRSVYASFQVMRTLFPETAAAPWARELDDLVGASERAQLHEILHGAPFDTWPSRPVQVWRKLRLLDSPGHRRRFVAAHVGGLARQAMRRAARGVGVGRG